MITPIFGKTEYAKRREQLAKTLDSNRDLVVLFTAPHRYRNHDSSYRFRPDSSYYYLTGFAEYDSMTFIWREGQGAKQTTKFEIFVLPRDLTREHWDGYRWGEERAKKVFWADAAYERSKFKEKLLHWLSTVPLKGQAPRILTNASVYPEWKSYLDRTLNKFHPPHRSGIKPLEAVIDVIPRIAQLRLIKSPAEMKIIREAANINVAAHLKVLEAVKPGLREYELQAICEYEYQRHGCPDPAYTSICASGANSTILHYIENRDKLKSGDLFLIDAGCEHHFYASDITRTYPVSGKYSKNQRIIMDLVHEAHQEVIQMIKPGLAYEKMHERATEVLVEGLIGLKLLKGKPKDIIKSLAHKKYYPHGTGHHLGHDVHDVCTYYDDHGESIKLQPGMLFTVEPGIYFMPEDKSVPAEWRGIGVRIEDDIHVTSKGAEVITDGLPRSADDIEKYMKKHKR